MAENTLQAEWIVTIHGNLAILFKDEPNVFVAMDNFIYPVVGDNTICTAPDVYVAFGRPKGHRGSPANARITARDGLQGGFRSQYLDIGKEANAADRPSPGDRASRGPCSALP